MINRVQLDNQGEFEKELKKKLQFLLSDYTYDELIVMLQYMKEHDQPTEAERKETQRVLDELNKS